MIFGGLPTDFLKKLIFIVISITVIYALLAELSMFFIAKLNFDTEVILANKAAYSYAIDDENRTNVKGSGSTLSASGKHDDTVYIDMYMDEFENQIRERLVASGTNKSDWYDNIDVSSPLNIDLTGAGTDYSQSVSRVKVVTEYKFQFSNGVIGRMIQAAGTGGNTKLYRDVIVDLDFRN